jgi:hypothetical protein
VTKATDERLIATALATLFAHLIAGLVGGVVNRVTNALYVFARTLDRVAGMQRKGQENDASEHQASIGQHRAHHSNSMRQTRIAINTG